MAALWLVQAFGLDFAKTDLDCLVAIALTYSDLSNDTWSDLDYRYRNHGACLVKNLSHADLTT
jgi:hypothetical protein